MVERQRPLKPERDGARVDQVAVGLDGGHEHPEDREDRDDDEERQRRPGRGVLDQLLAGAGARCGSRQGAGCSCHVDQISLRRSARSMTTTITTSSGIMNRAMAEPRARSPPTMPTRKASVGRISVALIGPPLV